MLRAPVFAGGSNDRPTICSKNRLFADDLSLKTGHYDHADGADGADAKLPVDISAVVAQG